MQGTGPEASSFVAARNPLDAAALFLRGQTISENMEEIKTTKMMGLLLEWLPSEFFDVSLMSFQETQPHPLGWAHLCLITFAKER